MSAPVPPSPPEPGEWWIAKANAACILQIQTTDMTRCMAWDEAGTLRQVSLRSLHRRFRRYGTIVEEERVILRSKLVGYQCVWKASGRPAEVNDLGQVIWTELGATALDNAEYDALVEDIEARYRLSDERCAQIVLSVEQGFFPVCR